MGINEIDEGLKAIEGRSEAFFKGTTSDEVINASELFLKVKFPESYKYFLRHMGCGGFNGVEFYGIPSHDFKIGPIPNGIWLTNKMRESSGLNHGLVLIAQSIEGYYALDTFRMINGECPVVDLIPGISQGILEVVFPDFGTFFLYQIRSVL